MATIMTNTKTSSPNTLTAHNHPHRPQSPSPTSRKIKTEKRTVKKEEWDGNGNGKQQLRGKEVETPLQTIGLCDQLNNQPTIPTPSYFLSERFTKDYTPRIFPCLVN